jgi:hypothetical protein
MVSSSTKALQGSALPRSTTRFRSELFKSIPQSDHGFLGTHLLCYSADMVLKDVFVADNNKLKGDNFADGVGRVLEKSRISS